MKRRSGRGARTRAITPSGYAAFVIDIDDRVRLGLLTGWGASGSATAGFVLAAPGQAIHDRKPAKGAGLIAIRDRRSQYLAIVSTERRAEDVIGPSVGSVGERYMMRWPRP